MIEAYQREKKALDEKFERDTPQQLPDGTVAFKIEKWTP
jgi:hypothetical protein